MAGPERPESLFVETKVNSYQRRVVLSVKLGVGVVRMGMNLKLILSIEFFQGSFLLLLLHQGFQFDPKTTLVIFLLNNSNEISLAVTTSSLQNKMARLIAEPMY